MSDPAVRPGRHLAGGPPRQPWDVLAQALAAERAEADQRAEAARRTEAAELAGADRRSDAAEPHELGPGGVRTEIDAGRLARLRSDLFDRLPVGGQRAAVGLGEHWWLPVVAALVALAVTIVVAVHVRPAAAQTLPSGAPPGTAPPTAPTATAPTATSTGGSTAANSAAPAAAPSISLLGTPPVTAGSPGSTASLGSPPSVPAVVVVDVAGRVRRPGVVRLPAGSRIVDAIRAAGGALPHTDLDPLDLAQSLSDGEQVRVGLPGVPVVVATGTTGTGSTATGGGTGGAAASGSPPAGPVDVNTATAEGLDALPGIGPVLAGRIVAWRVAHGPFGSVDDLEDVPGIGPTILGSLRPLVTVGP